MAQFAALMIVMKANHQNVQKKKEKKENDQKTNT